MAPSQHILDFLEDAGSYPHGPESVQVIQTHISYVAIVPPFVYKVKKDVELGFLDFSTLEKREYFCREEIRLNRRLCEDVYLDVVPISRKDDRLVFGEDGPVVDYAVKMRYMDPSGFMIDLVEHGELEKRHLDHVVEKLAGFYRSEQSSPETAAEGRIARLRFSSDENFEQTEPFVDSLCSRPAFEAIRFYIDRFYEFHGLLLGRRRANGHILECHGDLHLEHVHFETDRICIYDCIEFNERLRFIDVASDVAFLAMDLDFHELPALGDYLVERMSNELEDDDLPRLTDFYKCYRAHVRAKVESMSSADPEIDRGEQEESRVRARRYYQLALRYAAIGSKPFVVVVMGRVGTGKSTAAASLGKALGWDVLSSDHVRKELAGVPLHQRGSADQRAKLYTREMSERTYEVLRNRAVARAARLEGSILDATHGRRRHRDQLREVLDWHQIPYCFVELVASDQELRGRLRERDDTSAVVSDARLEDFEMLTERYEPPDDLEDARHTTVSTESALEVTVGRILKDLVLLNLSR